MGTPCRTVHTGSTDDPAYSFADVTTVLLVEDDPAIAQPLTRALQREGYEVRPAPTGGAAVAGIR